jgi:hypothetical protein
MPQFKTAKGCFCHPEKAHTYQIARGGSSLKCIAIDSYIEDTGPSFDSQEEEDKHDIDFPGVLKYVYAIVSLPFLSAATEGGAHGLDALFVLNRTFGWHVIAFNPQLAIFEILLHGHLVPPYTACPPRSDGHLAMSVSINPSQDPTVMKAAVYMAVWNNSYVTRVYVDLSRSKGAITEVENDPRGLIANRSLDTGERHFCERRPTTVGTSEHFNIGWNDPGCTPVTASSYYSPQDQYASILGILTIPGSPRSMIVLYRTVETDAVYIRHALIQQGRARLIDGSWWAGPLDPTAKWLYRWPLSHSILSSTTEPGPWAFSSLCIGPCSASLFSAEGLEGHVDFSLMTRSQFERGGAMAHAIINDLPSLLKDRPKEPFDTLIPRLIALSALQTQKGEEQDEAETEWTISEKGYGFRETLSPGVSHSLIIPMFKHDSSCNGTVIIAKHPNQLSYCHFGKMIDIISEIRLEEEGFGCPSMLAVRGALLLSYRAEHQTHVIPLNEDGEVVVTDGDVGLPSVSCDIPAFETTEFTLAVAVLEEGHLFVQITEREILAFRKEAFATKTATTFQREEIDFSGKRISHGCVHKSHVAVAVDERTVHIISIHLDGANGGTRIVRNATIEVNKDNASISCLALHDGHVALSTWDDPTEILVYSWERHHKDRHFMPAKPYCKCTTGSVRARYETSNFGTAEKIAPAKSLLFAEVSPPRKKNKPTDGSGDLLLCVGTSTGWMFSFILDHRVGVDHSIVQVVTEGKVSDELKFNVVGGESFDASDIESSVLSATNKWQIGTEAVQLRRLGASVYATSSHSALISFSRRPIDADPNMVLRSSCKRVWSTHTWNSRTTVPVPSISLDGVLVAGLDDAGTLVFGILDNRMLWRTDESKVNGTVTGLACCVGADVLVVTTSQSVQFWSIDKPVCLAVHEAPREAIISACAPVCADCVLVSITNNGSTHMKMFQITMVREEGKKTSVQMVPVAAGEFDGTCQSIAVCAHGYSSSWPTVVIAIDDHMLSLVKDVKELRVTRAWRSRCGNALALIANNGRFTAMAEAMGPIVVIDQQGKQVWAESGGRRRMVTAMTFLQEPTLTQGSWHLAVADRNANTIEVVTGRCKLNSTSSDNELTIVSTVKQSSHGIRIGSFLLGAHCGADQKAVLMVHNDGYIVDLKL